MASTIGSKPPSAVFERLLRAARTTWRHLIVINRKTPGDAVLAPKTRHATLDADLVEHTVTRSESGTAEPFTRQSYDVACVVMSCSDPMQLAAIHKLDNALAIWWRPVPIAVMRSDLEGFVPIRERVHHEHVAIVIGRALAATKPLEWQAALIADIHDLARRFALLMDVDRLNIRLEPVTDDACRRFHADYVRVRLITTYHGPGTEWTLRQEGETGRIHRMDTGHVGVFKGLDWAPKLRVLHRSPPIAGMYVDTAEAARSNG